MKILDWIETILLEEKQNVDATLQMYHIYNLTEMDIKVIIVSLLQTWTCVHAVQNEYSTACVQ